VSPSICAALAIALALSAFPVLAEPSPYIGRLNHAGFANRAHCTATLVSGGHIVTAAHCLPRVAGDIVTIVMGYDRGSYSSLVQASGADFRQVPARDIAILCNAAGPDSGIALADSPAPSRRDVLMSGYGRPRVHLQHDLHCRSDPFAPGTLRLDCAPSPGFSGAPVLVKQADGSVAMIGVVTAAGPGGGLAFELTQDLVGSVCGSG
jgi:hypothetical protein